MVPYIRRILILEVLDMARQMLFVMVLCMVSAGILAEARTGIPAPDFVVRDGDGHSLDSRLLRGKVVVGFYNDRDATKKNSILENRLRELYTALPGSANRDVFQLAVTDATPSIATSRWIWRRIMRNRSKTMGITLYGDWDGAMKRAYGIPDGESTFIVIDKKGILRYFSSGSIPSSEHEAIVSLIRKLTNE